MQLTRLHLLVLSIGLVCLGVGGYQWYRQHAAATSPALVSVPSEAPEPAKPRSVPVVSTALSSTPKPLKQLSAPMPVAQTKNSATDSGTYEVVKGDTLWRIARDQSPVRQGPGWVTIWRVNKSAIKNFDRIEVGLSLVIPQTVSAYATPYWKPRLMASRRTDDSIDLAELPLPPTQEPGEAGWPPPLPLNLQLALLRSESMPSDLAIALLKETPLPKTLAVALAKNTQPTEQLVLARESVAMPPPVEVVLDSSEDGALASLRLTPYESLASFQLR